MSDISHLLTPERVLVNARANCKREALALLAEKGAEATGQTPEQILAILQERERLGSTGVGEGFAIPHGKVAGLDEMVGVLAHLDTGVEFDAVDDQPVDLFFLLLAPEDASALHLKTLSKVARLMRSEEVRAAMRGASSAEALYAIAIAHEKPRAA